MKRLAIALTLALALATGCGAPIQPSSTISQSDLEANGLFSPKTPADRALTAEERQGDFDRFLELAQKEAVKWQKAAVLTGAQAENVDSKGAKAGGTKYTYTFASGKHGLSMSFAGNAIDFESDKAATPIKGSFVSAAQAIATAINTGKLLTPTYVVALAHPSNSAVPVYLVAEMKSKDAQKVILNAQTGVVIQ